MPSLYSSRGRALVTDALAFLTLAAIGFLFTYCLLTP